MKRKFNLVFCLHLDVLLSPVDLSNSLFQAGVEEYRHFYNDNDLYLFIEDKFRHSLLQYCSYYHFPFTEYKLIPC